jgi:hypothetical protein
MFEQRWSLDNRVRTRATLRWDTLRRGACGIGGAWEGRLVLNDSDADQPTCDAYSVGIER